MSRWSSADRCASIAQRGRHDRPILRAHQSAWIQLAYGARAFQIAGEPSWVDDERYDVDAKAEGSTSFDQMRPMLQALLAESTSAEAP